MLIGRIALNKCVPTVAPAVIAARVCSYDASVCPTAATTPASTIRSDRRKCAFAFRRDGDHADGPRSGRQQAAELGGVGVAHQGGLMRAAPHRGQPGAFEVNPVDQAVTDIAGQSGYLVQ